MICDTTKSQRKTVPVFNLNAVTYFVCSSSASGLSTFYIWEDEQRIIHKFLPVYCIAITQ